MREVFRLGLELLNEILVAHGLAVRRHEDARTGRGGHIEGHTYSGIAIHPVFLSPTSFVDDFDEAVDRIALLEASTMPNATTMLTYHDYVRFPSDTPFELVEPAE